MITDEQSVDDALRAAGRSFRAAEPTAVALNLDDYTDAPASPPRRHRYLPLVAAAVIVLALAVAGTVFGLHHRDDSATSAATDPSELFAHTWTLVSWDREGRTVSAAGVALTAAFSSRSFRGSDSCNSVSGSLRPTSSSIKISALGSTAVGCGRAGESARDVYEKVLGEGTTSWRIVDGRLHLTRGDLDAAFSDGPAPSLLANTSWTLGSWSVGRRSHEVVSTATNHDELHFISLNALNVGACEGVHATAEIGRTTIALSNIAVNACLSPNGPPYPELFDDTVSWRLDRTTLTLTHGSITLTYYLAA